MQFRSTTDEMLAARFDPESWVTEDGKRQATSEVPYRLGGRTYADYAPRPEFIPSRDPEPWVDPDFYGSPYRIARVFSGTTPGVWRWSPRPEYARPEPNPILVAIRRAYSGGVNGATAASSVAEWVSGEMVDGDPESLIFYPEVKCDPAYIEHARKVLARLVNIYKEV